MKGLFYSTFQFDQPFHPISFLIIFFNLPYNCALRLPHTQFPCHCALQQSSEKNNFFTCVWSYLCALLSLSLRSSFLISALSQGVLKSIILCLRSPRSLYPIPVLSLPYPCALLQTHATFVGERSPKTAEIARFNTFQHITDQNMINKAQKESYLAQYLITLPALPRVLVA